MAKIIKPSLTKSIINIPATILQYMGVRNNYPKNNILLKELRKKYKNIVFILFDGLGKSIIKKHLKKDDILYCGISDTLHSVFPPTTTAATTTYLTCSYPSEHGWMGWNMYFDKAKNVIDLFTNKESFTQTYVEDFSVLEELPVELIFDKIASKEKYKVTTIYPEHIKGIYKHNIGYKCTKDMFNKIAKVIANNDNNFVYCYNESPDDIMHEYGPSSIEAGKFVREINEYITKMSYIEDTLFIISADHGQVDIENRIFLQNYQDICDMLEVPPYIDNRAVCFNVKQGRKVEFYNLFNKYFSNEFVLHTKQTIIKKKYFGPTTQKVEKYIGDFVAIAYGHSIMQYTEHGDEKLFNFKGHHAGLMREEVEVPLIMIGDKKVKKR